MFHELETVSTTRKAIGRLAYSRSGNWGVGAALYEIEANVHCWSNEEIIKENPIGILTICCAYIICRVVGRSSAAAVNEGLGHYTDC